LCSTKIEWTDAAIDAATRTICLGLPLETDPNIRERDRDLADLARGICFGPNCPCWEKGRSIVKRALKEASKAQA
jgi:hypothetical protein